MSNTKIWDIFSFQKMFTFEIIFFHFLAWSLLVHFFIGFKISRRSILCQDAIKIPVEHPSAAWPIKNVPLRLRMATLPTPLIPSNLFYWLAAVEGWCFDQPPCTVDLLTVKMCARVDRAQMYVWLVTLEHGANENHVCFRILPLNLMKNSIVSSDVDSV